MQTRGIQTSSYSQTNIKPWPEGELRLEEIEAPTEAPSLYPFENLLETAITVKLQPVVKQLQTSIVEEVEFLTAKLAKEGVRLREPTQIREYLLEFPELIDVLPKAIKAVNKHIPEAQLILEMYHDPEIEDCYLVLCVRLREYGEDVMDRIEAAESEFIDLLASKEGWLQITTDFGEPEPEEMNVL